MVLDVREVTSFADYFVISTGANTRQIQAIGEEIQAKLKKLGEYPSSVEGYQNAEWVLLDYGDYVIHIFAEKARVYYDLERLWLDRDRRGLPEGGHAGGSVRRRCISFGKAISGLGRNHAAGGRQSAVADSRRVVRKK